MLLLNKSYFQVTLLFIFTTHKKDKTFHVVYEKYPNYIFLKFISIINFISFNNFQIISIHKLRNNFTEIKDQTSINEVNKYLNILFGKKSRTGGQIFIENILRKILWKSAVIDQIYNFYFDLKQFKREDYNYMKFIFNFLSKVRNLEKNLLIRFTVFKSTINYFLFFIKNILNEKIKNISRESKINNYFNFTKLIVHGFSKSKKTQKQDFLYNAINLFARDYKVKKLLNYDSFINLLFINISLEIKIIKFLKILYYLINLSIKFIISGHFIQDTKILIDKFIYVCLSSQKIKKKLDIYAIDPIDNKIIPILNFLKDSGNTIFFKSFSIGHYYTKSFSDYNGPYNCILSSHVGFEEIAKKSLFKGEIKVSKCYLSMANLKNKNVNNFLNNNDSFIKIIVVDGIANWFREIGDYDSMFFASILYQLDSEHDVNILLKKKKNISYVESYLKSQFPNNTIQFSDAERGFMGDFEKRDFIMSHGISSLAIKSSELFNKPYIIFDKYENSKNTWEILFKKSKVKPIFTNSKNSILRILMKRDNK